MIWLYVKMLPGYMMASAKREVILQTAFRLFNEFGFHATGIDRVHAEAGVSKATMYKYFRSKEELIHAVLAMRHQQFNAWITDRVEALMQERYQGVAEGALLAAFDALDEWIHSEHFYGCSFINATAEFSDPGHPIHEFACLHKQTVTAFIGQIMPPLSTQVDAEELARQLSLLIDGAMVSAQVSGHKDAAIRARKMAIRLLSSYGAVSDSVMKEEVLG